MSIDYGRMMLVGCKGSELIGAKELMDKHEDKLSKAALSYDAPLDSCIIGIEVRAEVPIAELGAFMAEVKLAATLFKELTGHEARLIATQDMW